MSHGGKECLADCSERSVIYFSYEVDKAVRCTDITEDDDRLLSSAGEVGGHPRESAAKARKSV